MHKHIMYNISEISVVNLYCKNWQFSFFAIFFKCMFYYKNFSSLKLLVLPSSYGNKHKLVLIINLDNEFRIFLIHIKCNHYQIILHELIYLLERFN